MKKHIIKFSVLIFSLYLGVDSCMGQIKMQKRAQTQFDRFAYSDAIDTYEKIVTKGKANQRVYQLLGDSYYNSGNLEKAHKSYEALFDLLQKGSLDHPIPGEYYFKYGQTLKAVNDAQKSREMLELWADLTPHDSRAVQIKEHKTESYATALPVRSLEVAPFNSEQADFGAVAYQQGYVFSSARENPEMDKGRHSWTNQNYTSLFMVTPDQNAAFTVVEPLLFEQEYSGINQASAVFSSDGNTMFFTANNRKKNGKIKFNKKQVALLKIFKASKLSDGSWGDLQELPINSDQYSCAHPALSADQKWLYFSSDMDSSYGESDLYRVKLENYEIVSQPVNLGDKINTPGRETFPFIGSDNTLYFSSDGALGYGGLDIYKVEIDPQGNFKEPLNIGLPLNSNFDDYAFYYNDQFKSGTLSSNRDKTREQIFLFNLCEIQLSGLVKELQSALALGDVQISISSSDGTQELFSDTQGNFSTDLSNCDDKVVLVATKQGYIPKEVVLENLLQKPPNNVVIELVKEQKHYVVDPIYFDFDKIVITDQAAQSLAQIVLILEQNPQMKLHISSYTDSRGSRAYNQKLSQRRADQTLQWFLKQGVEAQRMTTIGLGETKLVNDCMDNVPCTMQQHRLNRRSEFVIE